MMILLVFCLSLIQSTVRPCLRPIISPGSPGSWDDEWVLDGHVIWVQDTLKMWYLGINQDHGTYPYKGIGLACSIDSGKTWQKHADNPVFVSSNTSGWERTPAGTDGLWETVVVHEDGKYKMWYQCRDSCNCYNTLYATSPDGINWSRGNGGQPVLCAGFHEGQDSTWDGHYAGARTVIRKNSLYYLFYEGCNNHNPNMAAGLAIGINETTFVKANNLCPGFSTFGMPDTSWAGTSIIPNVVLDGNTFLLLYSSNSRLGIARSEDGIRWDRYSGNPVCNFCDIGICGGGLTSAYWDANGNLMGILRRIPCGIYACELPIPKIKP
jgi:hypothetical protein